MRLGSKGQAFLILLLSAGLLMVNEDRCIICAMLLFCFVTANKRSITFDIGDLLVFLSPFLAQVIFGSGIADALFIGIGFMSFYQLGKSVTPGTRTVLIPAGVFAVKGLLSFTYVLRFGSTFATNAWPDWSGDMMHGTYHEFWLVMIASLLIYFIIITVKGNYTGIIGIAASVAAVSVAVYGKGRLTFFACVVTAAVILVGIVIEHDLLEYRRYRIIGASLLAVGLIMLVLYLFNAFGLYNAYISSMWFASTGIFHDDRFSLMTQQIGLIAAHPFSTTTNEIIYNMNDIECLTVPNSWLQTGRDGSALAMLPMCAFTAFNVFWLIKIWTKCEKITKYALFAAFVGVSFLNMVESANLYIGTFWFMEIYLGGLLRGMYNGVSEKG